MYTQKAWEQNRYAEAERMYLASMREAESFGPHDLRLATSFENLANLYSIALERSDEAEALYERAKTIREQALGSQDPEVLRTLSLLASCYYEQGNYADAEPLYQRVLVLEEEALGPEHPSAVNLLSLLGSCYYKQSKYTQAEPFYQRIVATLGKVPRLDTQNFFTLVVSL
jgi:tetratricopeptide (TPR) repeat protein